VDGTVQASATVWRAVAHHTAAVSQCIGYSALLAQNPNLTTVAHGTKSHKKNEKVWR